MVIIHKKQQGRERADIGFIFILIYFAVIFLVVEIAIALLITTGLEPQIARFQVVSMMTSTGFTTKESELILRHPIRRKIAVFLILFGAFSLAVVISSISNILAQSFRIPQMIGISLFFGLVLLVVKNKTISGMLSKSFQQEMIDDFELHELPIQEILYIKETDLLTEVHIYNDSESADKDIADVFVPEEDMMLLFIQRGDEKIRRDREKLTIQAGDILFIYGNKTTIEKTFKYELNKMKNIIHDEGNISAL